MSKARPFIDTLRDIEAGGLLDELSEAQYSLIDAIRLSGKAGRAGDRTELQARRARPDEHQGRRQR